MELRIGERTLALVQGDITGLDTDAIVNAANSRLQHGGGVAAAISRGGGPTIQEESDRIGHCPRGGAVITSGGRLKARHVIHTVGPIMGDGDEATTLASCMRSSLELADEHGLRSLAFPAISTGIYGVPVELAARVLLAEARRHLADAPTGVERVLFCLFAPRDLAAFQEALGELADG